MTPYAQQLKFEKLNKRLAEAYKKFDTTPKSHKDFDKVQKDYLKAMENLDNFNRD